MGTLVTWLPPRRRWADADRGAGGRDAEPVAGQLHAAGAAGRAARRFVGLRQSLLGGARHPAILLALAAKPPARATQISTGSGQAALEPHQGNFDVARANLHFFRGCAIIPAVVMREWLSW